MILFVLNASKFVGIPCCACAYRTRLSLVLSRKRVCNHKSYSIIVVGTSNAKKKEAKTRNQHHNGK